MDSDFGSDIFDDGAVRPPIEPSTGSAADDNESAEKPAPKRRRTRKAPAARDEPDAEEPSGRSVEVSARGDSESGTGEESGGDDEPKPRKRRPRRRVTEVSSESESSKPDSSDPSSSDPSSSDPSSSDRDHSSEVRQGSEDRDEADRDSDEPKPAKRKRTRRSSKRKAVDADTDAEPSDGSAASDRARDDAEPAVARDEPAEDLDDRSDDDDGPRRRRSRRGGRSRRGEGSGSKRSGPRDEERSPRVREQWTRSRTPFPSTTGQRLAILIDVDALLAETRSSDSEIAFAKLHTALSGKCNVVRAVAFGTSDSREVLRGPVQQAGFDAREAHDSTSRLVAMAVEAMAIGPRVDCITVAPANASLGAAAGALRALGIRVVAASFDEASDGRDDYDAHQTLREECMFAP